MIGPTNASPKNTVLTDNVQTISAVKTFTASPIVPDTPSGTHSAVNQAYVESTVDGINNLVHKTGNENVAGKKTFTAVDPIINKASSTWAGPTSGFSLSRIIQHTDIDDNVTGEVYAAHDSTGNNHTQIGAEAYIDNGEGEYTVKKRAYLDVEVRCSDGKARLVFVSPTNVRTTVVDWTE